MNKSELLRIFLKATVLAFIITIVIILSYTKITGDPSMYKPLPIVGDSGRAGQSQQELLEESWQKDIEIYPRVNYGQWTRDISEGRINLFFLKEMTWYKDGNILKKEFHALLTYFDGRVYLGDVPQGKEKSQLIYIYDTANYQALTQQRSSIAFQETEPQVIFVVEQNFISRLFGSLGFGDFSMVAMIVIAGTMLVGFIIFIRWMMTRSQLKLPSPFKTNITYDDIGGLERVKDLGFAIESMAKYPYMFTAKGGGMPRGILFSGPPGTGKTLTASAIVNKLNEVGIPCYSLSCTAFIKASGSETGVPAARISHVFRQARKKAPCLIILDEIDVLAKERGTSGAELREEFSAALSQFLNELGGIEEYDKFAYKEGKLKGTVMVLAITNRPEIIDEALVRSGRIGPGHHFVFPRPNIEERKAILAVHARNKDIPEEHKENWLDWLAKETPGCNGADLQEILKGAANHSVKRTIDTIKESKSFKKLIKKLAEDKSSSAGEKISFEDIQLAHREVFVAAKSEREERFIISSHDKELSAYHQAGHTLVARITMGREGVGAVSVIPGREHYQKTFWLEELQSRKFALSVKELRDYLAIYGGGQAGEQTHFKTISTLGEKDFKKAYNIAVKMVSEFNMSKEIITAVVDKSEKERELSEKSLAERDAAIKAIMEERWRERPQKIIDANVEVLDALAQELILKEDLSAEEINAIFDRFILVDPKINGNHNS